MGRKSQPPCVDIRSNKSSHSSYLGFLPCKYSSSGWRRGMMPGSEQAVMNRNSKASTGRMQLRVEDHQGFTIRLFSVVRKTTVHARGRPFNRHPGTPGS
eukprot:1158174-Pelagomonas_calceolata.AAC.3